MTTNNVICVDLEPKWVDILHGVIAGYYEPEELRPACEIADKIRQAQKKGAISITFTFKSDEIEIEELYNEETK